MKLGHPPEPELVITYKGYVFNNEATALLARQIDLLVELPQIDLPDDKEHATAVIAYGLKVAAIDHDIDDDDVDFDELALWFLARYKN